MFTFQSFRRVVLVLATFSIITAVHSPAAAAENVPFKVYITELWQLDATVDPGAGLIADYYAKVTINGLTQDNNGACNDESLTGISVPLQMFKNFNRIPQCKAPTPWVFSQQVPAGQPVYVTIEIWDTDTVFDDQADAKPGDGLAVELVVDPVTGKWSGGNGSFDWPKDCSRYPLTPDDLGGKRVNVCWQASFDTDDDGLLDVWELFGVDTNNDGLIDIHLPTLGANRLRKDVFVEVDHLVALGHSHSPSQNAIAQIVTSFANSPVSNPDGTTGIQLHVDVGNLYGANLVVPVPGTGGVTGTYGDLGGGGDAIPEAGNEIIDAFHDPKGSATKFADLKKIYFDPLRDYIFRYAIFGHQTNARFATNDCTSGNASSMPGRDFFVTLGGVDEDGNPCWGTLGGVSVGYILEQAGTFMHELGHTLGLHHGGDEATNNKPNYLSVMNYSFQTCDVPFSQGLLPGLCDYSRLVLGAVLPSLDETNLDECVGIGGGLGFGAVDWNMNNIKFEGETGCVPTAAYNVMADINNDGVCLKAGANETLDTTPAGDDQENEDTNTINDGPNRFCHTQAKQGTDDEQSTAVGFIPPQPKVLKSFDDWGNLVYALITGSISSGGGSSPIQEEPDPTSIRVARRYMGEMMAPSVTVDETGPATGKPGDLLTYTMLVKNEGRGPALDALLTKTAPDGSSQTSNLGIIKVGDEVTQTSNFTVPSNACPGDFTSATASLSFKDFVGNQLTATDSVPLQILDVSAPTLSLSMSPSILWPAPNHKLEVVTANIVVHDNCDPNPKITLVSVTSNEPEAGYIGVGDRGPDIQGASIGTDDRSFSLRAERATFPFSTGRVYTITYQATDTSGNVSEATATVIVPRDINGQH